jgi:hypothetical protein
MMRLPGFVKLWKLSFSHGDRYLSVLSRIDNGGELIKTYHRLDNLINRISSWTGGKAGWVLNGKVY